MDLHNFEVLRHHDADEVVVDLMDVVDDPIDVVVALYNTADMLWMIILILLWWRLIVIRWISQLHSCPMIWHRYIMLSIWIAILWW